MSDVIEKLREDRKFFFALLAFVVFTALLVAGFIKEDGYKYLAAIAFFGYCCANVSQKVGLAWAEGKGVEVKEP